MSPGPVSDSYDPEWGTSARRHEIDDALTVIYERVTQILGGRPPMDIRLLMEVDLPDVPITAALSEREWRLIRFAIELAKECL